MTHLRAILRRALFPARVWTTAPPSQLPSFYCIAWQHLSKCEIIAWFVGQKLGSFSFACQEVFFPNQEQKQQHGQQIKFNHRYPRVDWVLSSSYWLDLWPVVGSVSGALSWVRFVSVAGPPLVVPGQWELEWNTTTRQFGFELKQKNNHFNSQMWLHNKLTRN